MDDGSRGARPASTSAKLLWSCGASAEAPVAALVQVALEERGAAGLPRCQGVSDSTAVTGSRVVKLQVSSCGEGGRGGREWGCYGVSDIRDIRTRRPGVDHRF